MIPTLKQEALLPISLNLRVLLLLFLFLQRQLSTSPVLQGDLTFLLFQ